MCLANQQLFTATITRQEEVREQEREAEMRDTEMLLADRIRFDVLMLGWFDALMLGCYDALMLGCFDALI